MPISNRINARYLLTDWNGPVGQFQGTEMKVVLGPAVNAMYMGSKANGTGIKAIMNRLLAEDPGKWVAGHLLAGELGGSGTNSNNLTPLTQNANKRMSSRYENKVKAWTIKCRQFMQLNKNAWNPNHCLGVFYWVKVSPTAMGAVAPYNKVAHHVKINAEVRLYNNNTKIALPAPIKSYFGNTKLSGAIENKFSDL